MLPVTQRAGGLKYIKIYRQSINVKISNVFLLTFSHTKSLKVVFFERECSSQLCPHLTLINIKIEQIRCAVNLNPALKGLMMLVTLTVVTRIIVTQWISIKILNMSCVISKYFWAVTFVLMLRAWNKLSCISLRLIPPPCVCRNVLTAPQLAISGWIGYTDWVQH